MLFSKVDAIQDNQGDYCLRFFFDANYETQPPQTHYIKLKDNSLMPFIYCSIAGSYYQYLFSPQNKEYIMQQCIKAVGGINSLIQILQSLKPIHIGKAFLFQ